MFVQNLGEKVSDAIEELGKLLDLLHKFPQQQRKLYLEKIQGLRNQMMLLRTNLKEVNALQTERQFNNLYLTLNTLKNKIEDENSLLVSKENRGMNHSKISRANKNTH
jgi:hypothetical protein